MSVNILCRYKVIKLCRKPVTHIISIDQTKHKITQFLQIVLFFIWPQTIQCHVKNVGSVRKHKKLHIFGVHVHVLYPTKVICMLIMTSGKHSPQHTNILCRTDVCSQTDYILVSFIYIKPIAVVYNNYLHKLTARRQVLHRCSQVADLSVLHTSGVV